MSDLYASPDVHAPEDERERFRADALSGMSIAPKSIAPKYLYDRTGSLLFEAMCSMPEYYLARAELSILGARASELAMRLGDRVRIVEPGAWSGQKTRLLLGALGEPRCAEYVPVAIDREAVATTAAALRDELPWLNVTPTCADFAGRVSVSPADPGVATTVYLPGSTLGNFDPAEAERLLARFRRTAGPGGHVLIGVDLKKDPAVIHAAYNDGAGVTAAFDKNLLVRMNRELDADFDTELFEHYAFYDPTHGRVEMHLVSTQRQVATVAGRRFSFDEGESMRTVCSYKYDLPGLTTLARRAALELADAWLDDARMFAMLLLRPIYA